MGVPERKYWLVLIVDNSVPRPEESEEFHPMWFNASPLIGSTDEGEDVLSVFTTEGKALAYGRAAVEDPTSRSESATLFPLASRTDAREALARWPASYVAVDPEYGGAGDVWVTAEEFLDRLAD